MVRNEETARELAQQTFLQAYIAKDKYQPRYPPGAWLNRIGYNITISYIRREAIKEKYMNRFKEDSVTVSDIARSDARIMLSKAMRFLNKEQREVIDLYYFQDLSDYLIAEKLGVAYTTIYRRRIQSIQLMRDRLGVVV